MKLLKLTQSEDHHVRLLGVKSLAEQEKWGGEKQHSVLYCFLNSNNEIRELNNLMIVYLWERFLSHDATH